MKKNTKTIIGISVGIILIAGYFILKKKCCKKHKTITAEEEKILAKKAGVVVLDPNTEEITDEKDDMLGYYDTPTS